MKNAGRIALLLMLSGSAFTSFGLHAKKDKVSFLVSPSNGPASDVTIESYLENFETLAKAEKWKEILSQGTAALQAIKNTNRPHDEAKICAQLTSTAFYLGDYTQALIYANRCHELSEEFTDQPLLIRALYLESAVHRALAAKNGEEQVQQAFYLRAVEIAEEAALIYSKKDINDLSLKGKVYFNLGAAYADNPKGDLEKAAYYYFTAIECFNSVKASDDVIRTSIRLGKVYLLQEKYTLSQSTLDGVRSQITSERLAMHADYLEAQLKLATHDIENATKVAKNGLARATDLGAKEDEARFISLLQLLENR